MVNDGKLQWTRTPEPISLRDWFAGQAMAAIVSCYTSVGKNDDGLTTGCHNQDMMIGKSHITGECDGLWEIAEDAYSLADAMLKARGVPDGK